MTLALSYVFNRKYIPDNIQGSYLRVMVDSKGIEPSTSADANRSALPAELRAQIGHFSIEKSYEKRIFEIFDFEEKITENQTSEWEESHRYGM